MMTLKELQESMQDYVLKNDNTIYNEIVTSANFSVINRLSVYQNAYYLRLIEILQNDFTVLYEIMGESAFAALVHDYLNAFPSHHFSVRTVGKYLAKFLKNNSACDSCYSEIAAFEWALNEALVAKDASYLTLEELAKIPPEEWGYMQFKLHPSVRVLQCCYNTMERWQSVNEGEGDIDAIKLAEPCQILIWRHEKEPFYCALKKEQNYLMQSIRNGDNFGVLCENMLDHFNEDEVVPWIAETLQVWVSEGIFSYPKTEG